MEILLEVDLAQYVWHLLGIPRWQQNTHHTSFQATRLRRSYPSCFFRAEFSKHQANVKLRQTNGTKHHLALRLRRNLGICHQWQSVTPSLGVNSPLLIVLKISHLRAVSGSSLGNMLGIGQKHNSKQTRDKKSSRTLQFLTQAIHIMNCTTSSYACAQQIFMIFWLTSYSRCPGVSGSNLLQLLFKPPLIFVCGFPSSWHPPLNHHIIKPIAYLPF